MIGRMIAPSAQMMSSAPANAQKATLLDDRQHSTLLVAASESCRRCWRAKHLGETVSFCGRVLTAGELNLVRQIIADFPRLSQAELAYTICELLQPELCTWRERWSRLNVPG